MLCRSDDGAVAGKEPKKEIDVLFYGGSSRRRKEIVSNLTRRAKRTNITAVFALDKPIKGELREDLIDQAKIVLNIHSVEARVLEVGHSVLGKIRKGRRVRSG